MRIFLYSLAILVVGLSMVQPVAAFDFADSDTIEASQADSATEGEEQEPSSINCPHANQPLDPNDFSANKIYFDELEQAGHSSQAGKDICYRNRHCAFDPKLPICVDAEEVPEWDPCDFDSDYNESCEDGGTAVDGGNDTTDLRQECQGPNDPNCYYGPGDNSGGDGDATPDSACAGPNDPNCYYGPDNDPREVKPGEEAQAYANCDPTDPACAYGGQGEFDGLGEMGSDKGGVVPGMAGQEIRANCHDSSAACQNLKKLAEAHNEAVKNGTVGSTDPEIKELLEDYEKSKDPNAKPAREWETPIPEGGMSRGNSADYEFRCRESSLGICTRPSWHHGQDWYPADFNDPSQRDVLAMREGTVANIRTDSQGYGKYVSIYHGEDADGNPVYTSYSHIEPGADLEVGQTVEQGQVIGKISGAGTAIGREIQLRAAATGVSYDQAYQEVMKKYSPDGKTWNSSKTAPHVHLEFNKTPNAGPTSAVDPSKYTSFDKGESYTNSGTVGLVPVNSSGGSAPSSNPIYAPSRQQAAKVPIIRVSTGNKTADTAINGILGIATQGFNSGAVNPSSPLNTFNSIGSLFGNMFGSGNSGNVGDESSFTQTPSSNNYIPTQTANHQLESLLDQQGWEMEYLMSIQSSDNPTENLAQIQSLREAHREQLQIFAAANPGADRNEIAKWDSLITSQIEQLEDFDIHDGEDFLEVDSLSLKEKLVDQQIDALNQSVRNLRDLLPTDLNTDVRSDLAVIALRANKTSSDKYRFSGSFTRILENPDDHYAFSEIRSYFGSSISHALLLDLNCDGSVDQTQDFLTPYYSVTPRAGGAEVLISEYMEVPEEGAHCFAFEVDSKDVLTETNEQNNLSDWRHFQTSSSIVTPTVLPNLNFQISVYTADGNITQDWTSEDVIISSGQEIAFKWDAPTYDQCIPLISSLTPNILENSSPVERNTLTENIDSHEHTGYYELRCIAGSDTRVESIHVKVE